MFTKDDLPQNITTNPPHGTGFIKINPDSILHFQ